MDKLEALDYEERPPEKGRGCAIVLSLISALLVLSILFVSGVSLIIFINPYSPLNPFPPPRPVVIQPTQPSAPTSTPTSMAMPTDTFTPEPTITHTPLPSETLPPSPTPFTMFTPSATPEPTEPPQGYPYILHQGSPIAIANISHPDLGCEWMGVAGQVFDLSGAPVTGLLIRLGGRLPGVADPKDMLSLTGTALDYGREGYYEFTLADRPIASNQSVWVQLVNQEYTPLSEKIYFDTYESCDKNLIIVNFKQVR
jgi:hypothetical protein